MRFAVERDRPRGDPRESAQPARLPSGSGARRSRGRAPRARRVGNDPEAAARVADGSFRWESAPEGWQLAIRELAAVLAADWQQLDLIA